MENYCPASGRLLPSIVTRRVAHMFQIGSPARSGLALDPAAAGEVLVNELTSQHFSVLLAGESCAFCLARGLNSTREVFPWALGLVKWGRLSPLGILCWGNTPLFIRPIHPPYSSAPYSSPLFIRQHGFSIVLQLSPGLVETKLAYDVMSYSQRTEPPGACRAKGGPK